MKIFAHRGFSGEYPENTMLAFRKAYETGCDGIELDVQLTKDGVPVIMHDETIDRTTDGKGNLRDYTYEQLCRFDCSGKFAGKYGFQQIPTLREYLEWVKDTGLITNIELKNSVSTTGAWRKRFWRWWISTGCGAVSCFRPSACIGAEMQTAGAGNPCRISPGRSL